MTMDLDELLFRSRPVTDEPSPLIEQRNRRRLLAAIEAGDRPATSHRPSWRRRLVYPAAVATAGLAAALFVVTTIPRSTDEVSTFDRVTTSHEVAATEIEACDGGLPLTVALGDDFGGPTPGPLPGFDAPEDGQLAVHWTSPASGGTAVELRWPAGPQPLYGEAVSASSATRRAEVEAGTGQAWDVYLFDGLDRLLAEGSDEPGLVRLIVPPEADALSDECSTMQLRVVQGSSGHHVHGFSVADPSREFSLDPLVIDQLTEAEGQPLAAGDCDGEPVERTTDSDQLTPSPTPAGAVRSYLGSAGDERLPAAGYVEIEASPAPVYGIPQGGFAGYSVLITVAEVDAGWVVDRVVLGTCP